MSNARKTAVDALCEVEKNAAYSNITLNNALKDSDLSDKDRALASAIFYGVLDRKITLDFILSKYLKAPISKLSSFTAAALRSALYQIMYMDKIPESAAVNETVNIIKKSKFRHQASFVNAVLRSILRNGAEIPQDDSVKSLSVRLSCPETIVRGFINDYGLETAKALLGAALEKPPIVLRVNTEKTIVEELIKTLQNEGVTAYEGSISNSLVVNVGIDVASLNAYKNGLFHVQDIASQTAVSLLDPTPNSRVMDVCAAPGGKSFTAAQYMQNRGELLSFDLYEKRAALISKGAERLGLDIIRAQANDATVYDPKLGLFDYVLCDVPCSGLGVIRRKPEIKYKDISDFSELEAIQRKILETAARYVKVGGRLLYSTCTLRNAENSDIVNSFLDKNIGYELQYERVYMPHLDGCDGFYCALILRTGESDD